MRLTACVAALSLAGLSACSDAALLARPEVTGTVTRGGPGMDEETINATFFLDEFSAFNVFATPTAYGFQVTSDGRLLTGIALSLTNFDALPTPTPTAFPVGMASEISTNGEYGIGLTYRERKGSDEAFVFDHMYNNSGGQSSGTFTVTDTDWDTFMAGELVGDISHDDGSYRAFDLSWRWNDHGDIQ